MSSPLYKDRTRSERLKVDAQKKDSFPLENELLKIAEVEGKLQGEGVYSENECIPSNFRSKAFLMCDL